jgi:membrane glycosyltransferase
MISPTKVAWVITVLLISTVLFLNYYSQSSACANTIIDGNSTTKTQCYGAIKTLGLSIFALDKNINDQVDKTVTSPDIKDISLVRIAISLGTMILIAVVMMYVIYKIAMFGSSDGQHNTLVVILMFLFAVLLYAFISTLLVNIYLSDGNYHYYGQGVSNFVRNINIFFK